MNRPPHAPDDRQILSAMAELESFAATLRRFPDLTRADLSAALTRLADALPPAAATAPAPRTASAGKAAVNGRLRIYSDGAARGNPGPAGAGAVLVDEKGQVLAELGRFLGEQTNNVAEYEGLLLGLHRALALGATEVEVLADSQLVIRQLSGAYRVRNEGLRPLYEQAKRLLGRFRRVELRHIPREMNGAADEMSNRAIDEKLSG